MAIQNNGGFSKRESDQYQVPVLENQFNPYRQRSNQTTDNFINPQDNPYSSDREKKAHNIAEEMGLTGGELGFGYISNGFGFI